MLIIIQGVLQNFCITDPFFPKNQQMDFKPKELHSQDCNLLFDTTVIPREAFFVSITEFVGACGIPYWVLLSNSLLLWGSSLVLVRPTLNLWNHWVTVVFVIIFCIPYITHILVRIYLTETFFRVKRWITTLCCLSFSAAVGIAVNVFSHHHVIFYQLLQNFTCALGTPSVTCMHSFGSTVFPHAENVWAMQNFEVPLAVKFVAKHSQLCDNIFFFNSIFMVG